MAKIWCVFMSLVAGIATAAADPHVPEPGPENGSLRMRLVVRPYSEGGQQAGFNVTVALLNVSERPVTLRANWPYEGNQGDLKAFIEAATSVETYPPMAPWVGGIQEPNRESPQPEHVLEPGDVLSVNWKTGGHRLKENVTDPHQVQNPELLAPGLYSIHATIVLPTGDGDVLLRSNEQLVSIDGSRELPQHCYGSLLSVDPDANTANLGLGALHKIELGDQFLVLTGKREAWKLTVARVEPSWCQGSLEPIRQIGPNPAEPEPRFPLRGSTASLILGK